LIIAAALFLATPFFIVFGSLSDRIGRKKIVMAGCILAALTYFPAFKGLTHFANPALDHAVATAPITVEARTGDCSFPFDPLGKKTVTKSCDVATSVLAKAGVPYVSDETASGSVARVRFGNGADATYVESFAGETLDKAAFTKANGEFVTRLKAALAKAGYPAK